MTLVLSLFSHASNQSVQCCTNRGPDQQFDARQLQEPAEDQSESESLPALISEPAGYEDKFELQPAASEASARDSNEAIEDRPRARKQPSASQAQHCLSLNVYWEARNQSIAGQIAVAQVTLNRARDRRYPNDICEVVYEHKQFSWYWDGKSDAPREPRAWETSMLVASAAMAGSGHAELQGVMHYHAVYSKPYWRSYMTHVATIGDHIFYSD